MAKTCYKKTEGDREGNINREDEKWKKVRKQRGSYDRVRERERLRDTSTTQIRYGVL